MSDELGYADAFNAGWEGATEHCVFIVENFIENPTTVIKFGSYPVVEAIRRTLVEDISAAIRTEQEKN